MTQQINQLKTSLAALFLVMSMIFVIAVVPCSADESSLSADGETSAAGKSVAADTKQETASTISAVELSRKGEALLNAGKGEESVRVYQKAVSLEAENAGLRQRLAKALYRIGREEEAVKQMEFAVTFDPNRSLYHSELAWLYTQVNRLRSAVRHAKIAIKLAPEDAYPYIILGYSESSEAYYGPAIMTLNKAIALDPDNPLAHRYLADTLYQDGQYEKALSAFEKAARLNPKNVNVLIGMGNVYGKLNQKEKQKETYRKAVELAPADPEAHGHYAWALSNTGDFLGAMKEGFTTNSLRLKASWEPFMGMFISVWAGIFIIFGVIFSAIVSGAGFTPQSGEDLVKSFFLTMYKDKPGRFVVTSKRLVFVPELVSRSFGATRVSIQRDEISSVVVDAGKLVVSSTSGTEHVFKMPKLVLDPLIELLEKESVGKKEKQKKTGKAKKAQGGNSSESGEESKSDEKKVLAASFDFRPDASSDSIDVIAPAPVDKADSMSVADKSAKVAEESASKGREKSDSKSPTGKKTQKKSNKKAGSKSPAKKPAKKPGESPEKGGPS